MASAERLARTVRLGRGVASESTFGYAQAAASGTQVMVAGQIARDCGSQHSTATAHQVACASARVRELTGSLGVFRQAGFFRVHPTGEQVDSVVAALRGELAAGSAVAVEPVAALMEPTAAVEISGVLGAGSDPGPDVGPGDPLLTWLGASAAVRCGEVLHLSGLMAFGEDGMVGAAGVAEQWAVIERRLDQVLHGSGARRCCVIATQVAVLSEVGESDRAALVSCHRATFGAHPPASTVTLVPALAARDALVQLTVQATAIHDCTRLPEPRRAAIGSDEEGEIHAENH